MAAIDYVELNKFQNNFYTNVEEFKKTTKHEVKRNGYTLLNSLGKGYPYLADLILNLKSFNWNGPESHQILIALQKKFINNFNNVSIPQFIFWKTPKQSKQKDLEIKNKKGLLIFNAEISAEIQSILMYDCKTYETFKFTDKVQELGKSIIGETIKVEKTKRRKKK